MLSACKSLLHAIVQYLVAKHKRMCVHGCVEGTMHGITQCLSCHRMSQTAYGWEESTITTAGAVTLCITAQCNDGAWHGLCIYIWQFILALNRTCDDSNASNMAYWSMMGSVRRSVLRLLPRRATALAPWPTAPLKVSPTAANDSRPLSLSGRKKSWAPRSSPTYS